MHKNSSQVCILTEDGELIERRIKTDRESFDKLLGERPPARILVEASTESEWCARHLEALGHEVIFADPNFAPMYATRITQLGARGRVRRTSRRSAAGVLSSSSNRYRRCNTQHGPLRFSLELSTGT